MGGVCRAGSGGASANLQAYVYTYTPSTQVWGATPVLQFALDYPRNCADENTSLAYSTTCATGVYGTKANWLPWRDTLDTTFPGGISQPDTSLTYPAAHVSHPQPMLTDIEFVGNRMTIGLRDRFGDQIGFPDPAFFALPISRTISGTLYNINLIASLPAGDVLRASQNVTGTWTLESNSQSSPAGSFGPSSGASNGQGPGNGEFFVGDGTTDSVTTRRERSFGGLAYVPGTADTMLSAHSTYNMGRVPGT